VVSAGPIDVVGLLLELVRTPSPSGQEDAAAGVLAAWALARGLEVSRDDAAVRITVPGRSEGPTLLFASHLDTVPPGDGWTVDPYAGAIEGDRLVARGAADAKGPLAAMTAAAATLAAAGGPARGRLIVMATYSEETRDTTMPEALRRLGAPADAAVVGEPTSLEACVAQRGQLLLRLVWAGEQVHAGWSAGRVPRPGNAIERAAEDIVRLGGLEFELVHPALGKVALTPTMIGAGVARNVTPPRCEAVLDIRTTPAYAHAEITETVREQLVNGTVEVISDRLVPAETPANSRLLAALRTARPGIAEIVSPTCSDWVFLREVDAVKLGPGDSRRSHTADEAVSLDEVRRAVDLYAALAGEYLA
jgi:acetylornithine deacetylase